MKNLMVIVCFGLVSLFASFSFAGECPDPQSSSLKWGEVPSPWLISPFSANRPQGDVSTRFDHAFVMVAGLGVGVSCTYRNSLGNYSIWWPVSVKIPSRMDYAWIDVLGGFICTQSLQSCSFSVAD